MSGWLYCKPGDTELLPPFFQLSELVRAEQVGARELRLLLRARQSRSGLLVTDSTRAGNSERLAARRLTMREKPLLRRCEIRGSGITVWSLTERGRTCWLRVKS